MDVAKRFINTSILPFLILIAYSVGVSSFTVAVGVAGSIGPTTYATNSKSCVNFPDSANTMSSNSSGSSSSSSSSQLSATLTDSDSIQATTAADTDTQRLPWRDTNYSPLTGSELQIMVVEAAMKEEDDEEWTDDEDSNDAFLDVPGIAWIEHLNLIVGHCSEDRSIAEAFYLDVLGMTPDKGSSFHVNLGRQQFHLATPKEDCEIPHRIHGSVGLAVPNLEALWARLEEAKNNKNKFQFFQDTLFDFYREDGPTTTTTIHVRCPWGNVFRCYSAKDRGTVSVLQSEVEKSPQKMSNLHAPHIGFHGADKMGVLGVGEPGIRYVEFVLPVGSTASKVCEFYRRNLKTQASVAKSPTSGTNCCLVSVGPGIHLVYVEAPSSLSTTTAENISKVERELFSRMEGVHLCIYVHNFHGLYKRLGSQKLLWTNPRFTRLDKCDTWEDSRKSRTLRFKHVIDIDTNDTNDGGDTNNKNDEQPPTVLMELEHETRALRHGQFMKVPYYVPK